jgi:hypothetical protein
MRTNLKSLRSLHLAFAVLLVSGGLVLSSGNKVFADSANLSLDPETGTVAQGGAVVLSIYENSAAPVNAASVRLSYPADLLEYSSTTSSSAFSIEAATAGGDGKVKLDRGALPAVSGKQLIATLHFKAKSTSGLADLNFEKGSVLVSSTSNTNILSSSKGAHILIGAGSGVQNTTAPDETNGLSANKSVSAAATDDSKLLTCQSKENSIKNIMLRMTDRAQKQLDLFTTVSERTQGFYTNSGKSLANYSSLVDDANAKKTAASSAINTIKEESEMFSCSNGNPKDAISEFKNNVNSEIASLQSYRASVKNLLVGVKSLQSGRDY